MRRIGLLLAAAGVLAAGRPAAAQTWDGGGGTGNWSTGANWVGDVPPASAATTAITLAGTVQTVTVQDIAAAFQLNRLAMSANAAPNGFTVNPAAGSRLQFAGTAPTLAYTGELGTAAALVLNTDVEVGTAGLTVAFDGTASGTGTFFEVVVGGRLLGSGTVARDNQAISDLVLRGAGGTFAGTFNNGGGSGGVTFLAARDVFARGVVLNTGTTTLTAVNLALNGQSTNPGLNVPGAFNQQVGTLGGVGQVVLSNTALTAGGATLLAGFNNTDSTLGGTISAPAPGGGPAAHFGKVGTGTQTLTAASTGIVGGVSVRGGAVVVSGSGSLGSQVASPTTPLTLSTFAGAELRTVSTGAAATSRLQNNAVVALSGGTLRLDGTGLTTAAAGYTEQAGVLQLGPGQSVVRVDGSAARGARLLFDSLAAGTTAAVRFESNSLGVSTVDTAGAANVAFTTVPPLVGGGGTTATNQSILPQATAGPPGTGSSTTLVTYDAATASVRGLADGNYAPAFGTATDNVSLAAATTLTAAQTANSLRLSAGGSVATNGNPLTLTSGSLLAAGGGVVTGTGNLLFGAGGAATAVVTTTGTLSIDGGVQAANLSKNGPATLTLNGPVAVGNGAVLAVNAGELNITPSAVVTAANGALTYQVARGASVRTSILNIVNTQLLTGAGSVTGATVVVGGGTVAPSSLGGPQASGAAPGVLTVGNTAFQPTGSYRWFLSSVLGGEYTQSLLQGAAGATLDLSLLRADARFTITPDSLLLSNADGVVYDFDRSQSYVFTIASFPGGITGFSADKFTVSVAEFQNVLLAGDAFTVRQAGNDLQLAFTPVPEPVAVVGVLAAGLGLARRLRRGR